MNWNKILNMLIVFFLIMNIVLGALYIYGQQSEYTLSSEQESQLDSILSENGIAVYDYLPDYFPMKKINLEVPVVEQEKVLEKIFADESYQVVSNEDNTIADTKYTSDYQEIIFYEEDNNQGIIYYKGINDKYIPKKFEKEEIIKVADKFARDITLNQAEYVLVESKPYIDEGYYYLEFYETFKDELLFCNYVKIKITKEGEIEANARRYPIITFQDEELEIFPINEVLYKFMNEIDSESDKLIRITDIDIGYILGFDQQKENFTVEAVPHYRITIDQVDTYYIEAYTNKLRKGED